MCSANMHWRHTREHFFAQHGKTYWALVGWDGQLARSSRIALRLPTYIRRTFPFLSTYFSGLFDVPLAYFFSC